jgi:hypothetical protein
LYAAQLNVDGHRPAKRVERSNSSNSSIISLALSLSSLEHLANSSRLLATWRKRICRTVPILSSGIQLCELG